MYPQLAMLITNFYYIMRWLQNYFIVEFRYFQARRGKPKK